MCPYFICLVSGDVHERKWVEYDEGFTVEPPFDDVVCRWILKLAGNIPSSGTDRTARGLMYED